MRFLKNSVVVNPILVRMVGESMDLPLSLPLSLCSQTTASCYCKAVTESISTLPELPRSSPLTGWAGLGVGPPATCHLHSGRFSSSLPPTSFSTGPLESAPLPPLCLHLQVFLSLSQYAAVDDSGCNLALAGRAGFALHSGLTKKWKLFGNEIQVSKIYPSLSPSLSPRPSQEQSMMCRGGLLWYRDIVVFPCRVQERHEEVQTQI